MNRIMVICDEDPFYAGRLADYANQKGYLPFMVVSFSSAERLKQYLDQQKAEILLLGGDVPEPGMYRQQVRQLITLNDGSLHRSAAEFPTIYKFQSADRILREVMTLCEQVSGSKAVCTGTGLCTMTGIFSPVNRCGKTSFSLAYAQTMAAGSRTLYVNLEDCSGFGELLGQDGPGDFSDVLYYFRQNALSQVSLCAAIHSLGEVDYIPPVRYPEDLFTADADELAAVLKHIAAAGGYQVLVVDLGVLGKLSAGILEIFDVIYMPVLEDPVSAAKIAEFERYLELSNRLLTAERIRKLVLPGPKSPGNGGSWPLQLLWGELGDYVRQLIHGGGGNV